MPKRKVCIFGTFHGYQYKIHRPKYLQELRALIEIHSVDLVAEEASSIEDMSYIRLELQKAEFNSRVTWKNVDITQDERALMPDINPIGLGTLYDFNFYMAREKVWVRRTVEAMKDSALLICGIAHTFSIAEKFRCADFEVETNVYFDKLDEPRP